MPDRAHVLAAMWYRRFVMLSALIVAACSSDYTPVRDWAGTASAAADYPSVAIGRSTEPDRVPQPAQSAARTATDRSVAPVAPDTEAILAMQDALGAYLTAIATLAADGALPYRDDPFVQLAARAALASESGGKAVADLGALLRQASLTNARASEMVETIVAADSLVQTLVSEISNAVARIEPTETQARADQAAYYARLEREAREPAARQSARNWAAFHDREFAARAAVRTQYADVLTRIAEGHALLKARARHMTQEETARMIRAQADRLQRAAAALPRTPLNLHRRPDVGANPNRSGEVSNAHAPDAKRDHWLPDAGE